MAVKRLAGFRFAEIRYGDSLQTIAARELGNAELWTDLIAINDLVYPYLTSDPNQAGPNVRLYGSTLIVPSQDSASVGEVDAARVLLVDFRLRDGLLEADESGDLAVVSGMENFKQAIRHRIDTPLKQLIRHLTYGCEVHSLIGQGALGGIAALAAGFVRAAILADPRSASVENAKATVIGDAVRAVATVQPISGTSVDIEVA